MCVWFWTYFSYAYILLKLFKLVPQQGQLCVDLSAALNHGIYLIGESHILSFLCDQVTLYFLFESFYLLIQFQSRLFCRLLALRFDHVELSLQFSYQLDLWNHLLRCSPCLFLYLAQLPEHGSLFLLIDIFSWRGHLLFIKSY